MYPLMITIASVYLPALFTVLLCIIVTASFTILCNIPVSLLTLICHIVKFIMHSAGEGADANYNSQLDAEPEISGRFPQLGLEEAETTRSSSGPRCSRGRR